MNLIDVHVTEVTTPIEVDANKARLTNVRGTLMGGTITGSLEIGLESTPKFDAHLAVEGVDLRDYARGAPRQAGLPRPGLGPGRPERDGP